MTQPKPNGIIYATEVPQKRPHFTTSAEMSRERSSPFANVHLSSDSWTQCDYAISSRRHASVAVARLVDARQCDYAISSTREGDELSGRRKVGSLSRNFGGRR